MARTPPNFLSDAQLKEWAANHPLGTPVRYYPIRTSDKFHETTIQSEPWRLGHGEPVVSLENVSGGVALWAIKPSEAA